MSKIINRKLLKTKLDSQNLFEERTSERHTLVQNSTICNINSIQKTPGRLKSANMINLEAVKNSYELHDHLTRIVNKYCNLKFQI